MIRGASAAALVVLALSAGAEAAPHNGLSEAELRSLETRTLGADHAAAHARRRELARSRAGAPAGPVTALAEVDPEVGGRWSAPFSIPVMGINAVMLPTGKVLWFAYPVNPSPAFGDPNAPNSAQAYLWNPATGKFKRVDPPIDPATGKPANIWCAGQTLLADGRVLVAGGNLAYANGDNEFAGLDKLYTFNPWDETWTVQPDMAHGRWYPSTALLPDGRALIVGGLDETGGPTYTPNLDIEIFKPADDLDQPGTVTKLGERGLVPAPGSTPPDGGLYPHLFWMPSGRLLFAGPDLTDSWAMHSPGTGNTWPGYDEFAAMSRRRLWSSAVLMPGTSAGSPRVRVLGGSETESPTVAGEGQATATTETYNESTNNWSASLAMQVPRSHLNTVLLPDGSMVSIGGGIGTTPKPRNQWAVAEGNPERAVDLFDPATNSWRLGSAQAEGRAYHSTAVLLPDARVVSAGDDLNGGISQDTAEIYEPPYLFAPDGTHATRPRITSAPRTVAYGEPFGAATPDTVTRAALVAPGSTTHANDMNQRVVSLDLHDDIGGVSLEAPSDADIAPPGWYMLFLLDANGVPSVAHWILLGDPPPAQGRIEIETLVEGAAASGTRFGFAGAQFDGVALAPGGLAARNLPGGSSATVAGGHYSITQNPASGYDVVAVECDDGDSLGSVASRSVRVNLAAGETVRCTFVNRKRPAPPAEAPGPKPNPKPPASKDTKGPTITVTGLKWRGGVLSGRVEDASGVERLKAALATRRRGRCRWWSRRAGRLARRASCRRPRWMTARVRRSNGRVVWKVRLKGPVPAGRYLVALKARDERGNLTRLLGSEAPRVRVKH